MDNPKIKIESDGKTAVIYLDGKNIPTTLLDFSFHGDVENGVHIKWDGIMYQLSENGVPLVQGDKVVTEKFNYDSREEVTE